MAGAGTAKTGCQVSYNFKDFDAQFPDDAACLDFIFRARFANHVSKILFTCRQGTLAYCYDSQAAHDRPDGR